jgi:hypothetical protein
MSRHTKAGGGAHGKEIRAWGIRHREVDINQLALAYYLLARIRIEEQRQAAGEDAANARAERRSEAA